MSEYRGMAHFPADGGANHCWECSHFLHASDQDKGRCVKYLEFVGKLHQLDNRYLDANWWRGLPTINRFSLACKYLVAVPWTIYELNEAEGMSRPNYREAAWLKRIAASPLMLTKVPGEDVHYSLQDGTPVPEATARRLIACGWLKAQRDGLWEEPQTYRALTP